MVARHLKEKDSCLDAIYRWMFSKVERFQCMDISDGSSIHIAEIGFCDQKSIPTRNGLNAI